MKLKNPASAFLLFVVLFYLVASFLVGGMAFVLVEMGMLVEDLLPWIIIARQVVGLLLPLGIWLALTKDSFKRNMPHRPLGGKNILIIVLLSFSIQPIANLISAITSLFVTNDIAEMVAVLSATPWWLLILAMAVTPGIIEELVFRGYIQTNTRGKTFAKIAVMNGLMFALIHMNLHQFAYTFALGIFLAYVVYITKSIWAGIIIHFIVNATQVSLLVGSIRALEFLEALIDNPELSPWWYNFFAGAGVDLVQLTSYMQADMPVDIAAVMSVAIIAIPAAIISVMLFYWLVSHNRERGQSFENQTPTGAESRITRPCNQEDEFAMLQEWGTPANEFVPTEDFAPANEFSPTGDDETDEDVGPRFRIDWCLVVVVVIWIAFVVFT